MGSRAAAVAVAIATLLCYRRVSDISRQVMRCRCATLQSTPSSVIWVYIARSLTLSPWRPPPYCCRQSLF